MISAGEDHEGAFLELVDRAPPDVRLGDLGDRDRGLDPEGHADRLELRLQRQRVDDHREHAHVVARRFFDAMFGDGRAADDVAAADDHRHLDTQIADLADLLGEVPRVLRGDAEFTVSEKCFA